LGSEAGSLETASQAGYEHGHATSSPGGLRHTRHHGLLANGNRKTSVAAALSWLGLVLPSQGTANDANADHNVPCCACWHCGASMIR